MRAFRVHLSNKLEKSDVSEGTVPLSPGPSGKLTVKDLINELIESGAIPKKNVKTSVSLPRFIPIDSGSNYSHVGGRWGRMGMDMGCEDNRLHNGDLIVADQPYGPSNKESIKLYLSAHDTLFDVLPTTKLEWRYCDKYNHSRALQGEILRSFCLV